MQVVSRGPNDQLTIIGPIVALISGGVQIEGGQGVGYFDVYINSQTQITGPKPFVGEYIEASGTGTGSLNATTVAQIFAISGPVVALKTGGFQIQAGAGLGYMNVWTSQNTVYWGAKPYVGEVVQVYGNGQMGNYLNAIGVQQISNSTPTPSPTGSPGAVNVSGPIVAMKSGGFQMQGPRGIGYVNVYVNQNTRIVGPQPYVGETVEVNGNWGPGGTIDAQTVSQITGSPQPSSTPLPTSTPQPSPTPTGSFTPPPVTGFMPSTWAKISAFQVFDETSNGYITRAQASADGYRYNAVWGSRWNIGTAWNDSNPVNETAYYNTLETDESSTGWGAIGHPLAWWQANHPDWVLYACDSNNNPTNIPAWIPGLNNVPLDVHNPQVIAYQIASMADYAHQIGYHALAIDEAVFWQADEGFTGGYGCGIYQNGQFVRRYTGTYDPNWAADVVAWVQLAHHILTTDPVISQYHLKMVVNHPADQLTSNETTLLANVDAVLDETGYSDYGNYKGGSAATFAMTTDWAKYAQDHGTAVLMNDNWGNVQVGTPQLDYSIATYLMGNEQGESLFASPGSGYGLEQYHQQYTAPVGAPCGEYYSAHDPNNPSIYYRRFANAIVVVNGGSGSNNEVAYLPSGHTYSDVFGRGVSNPLTIDSNDGYVLMTANGCN